LAYFSRHLTDKANCTKLAGKEAISTKKIPNIIKNSGNTLASGNGMTSITVNKKKPV